MSQGGQLPYIPRNPILRARILADCRAARRIGWSRENSLRLPGRGSRRRDEGWR